MFVLGTAGHVDHGKSSLLKALTGQHPDRLPEERKRGMTIDLNFVWLETQLGRIGIVDVPGHQKFLGNMISGACALDGVLLTVAADDGWMPQTEEHLQILKGFGVQKGILVLTKIDLVSAERVCQIERELLEYLELGFGFKFPLYRFSTEIPETRLEVLRGIEAFIGSLPRAKNNGNPRVWIDRVFVPQGLGAVVTGTLREGSLSVGEEIRILPQDLLGTVKGLQAYQRTVESVPPVSRVAIQIGKIPSTEIQRGQLILKASEPYKISKSLDVKIQYFNHPLKRNSEVSLHHGVSRVLARALPSSLETKEHALRILLKEPLAVRIGDPIFLRSSGEERSLGFGVVIAIQSKIPLRKLPQIAAVWDGTEKGFLEGLRKGEGFLDLKEYSGEFSKESLQGVLARSEDWECLSQSLWVDRLLLERGLEQVEACLKAHFEKRKKSISLKGLEAHLHLDLNFLEPLVERLAEQKKCRLVQREIFWGGQKTEEQLAFELKVLKALEAENEPLRLDFVREMEKSWCRELEREGKIVALGEGYYLLAQIYQAHCSRICGFLESQGNATTSDLKTVLGWTRKFAVLLLEQMDRNRLTYLKDGVRALLKSS